MDISVWRVASIFRSLGLFLAGFPLEPAQGLPFTGQAPPKAAMMVQRTIAEGAQAVMLRVVGPGRQLQKSQKRLLENIFGFSVAQTQGAPIKYQPGRLVFVKRLAPPAIALRGIHALA